MIAMNQRPSENSTLSAVDSFPLNTNGPSAWIDFPIPLAAGLTSEPLDSSTAPQADDARGFPSHPKLNQ